MFVSVCPHDDLKVIADICFLLGGSKTRNHVLGAPHTSVKIRRVEKKSWRSSHAKITRSFFGGFDMYTIIEFGVKN